MREGVVVLNKIFERDGAMWTYMLRVGTWDS